ncbi:MAG TPA: CHAT domain-containing tetratricopeptide repeat protein [Candidatus Angelobacter sp.]|nr:CHAT domain-containing tetratricopeptide repeat protein [Candidatus Angelobacter sp.]
MKLRRGGVPAALRAADLGLKQFPSKESEWHWRFQYLEAEILDIQGKEREALALLEEELPPAFATSDLAVRRKATQGSAHISLFLMKEAEQDLAEAEALAKKYHPELLGDVTLKHGTLQFTEGHGSAAETDYKKARELAREQKDSFLEAAALSGLGVAATMQGHYDESIGWNREAAELSQAIGAAGSMARTLGNTGWNYTELGDYQSALKFYKQAEEVAAKNSLFAARTYWLTSTAYAYQGLGDDANAAAILNQALELARTQDAKDTLAQCLSQLAWIAVRAGSNDRAEEYNQEAAALAENGPGPRLAIDSRLLRGTIAANRHNYDEADKVFLTVTQDPQANKIQRWRAQAELANVYASAGLDAKAEKEYRLSLSTIEDARASISSPELRLTFLFNTIRFYSNFIDFLMARHRVGDALEVAELSRARTLAEGLGAVPKTLSFPLPDFHPQRIAERRKAVLLMYWLGPQQSYLWAITATKTGSFTIAKQSEVEALVSDYREAMQRGKDLLSGENQAGEKLYAMLVAPAQKLIAKDSRVIVLADANLSRLNFEAFIVPGRAPHYWIEDVTVSTASSLTLLASRAAEPGKAERGILLVGNTEPNQDFPALAQAAEEVQAVEKYFPPEQREVLERKQATATGYLQSHPESFSYIHFVTHGTSNVSHPLESAVILSPEGDSYKLYARDIVGHHLNAKLVTISACNGAGTQSYSGEGLVGLSWAFMRAGAHNVIGALWEVSDVSTPQLMDSLYGGLSKGKDPATALRDAKLAMLHSADAGSVFRKPFYWAPFQLYAGS